MVTFTKNFNYDFSSISDKTPDEISEDLIKILDKVIPIVFKVENKFLEYQDELLELKNVWSI